MQEGWDFVIFIKDENGQIFKISAWEDLSMFLLLHWPVNHGMAYTAAVCSLSQYYYNKSNINSFMPLFISALNEAELPYSFKPYQHRYHA